MIDKLIRASIKNRALVLVLTFMVTLVGIYNAFYLSIDAIPDVTNVQVSAVTSSPGLSPLEVEQFITYPIEMEFTGLPNVTEIRSISRAGVSSVTVVFKDGTDIYFARQLVNERIKQAEAIIPPDYGRPELSPIATGL
ncbi:efflux RND transporter permease subunit, partial [Leptospira interrogans]